MEMIIIFNMGKDAARLGAPRAAPDAVDYPIVNRFENRVARVKLDAYAKRQWLAGYDAGLARIRGPKIF